MPTLEDYESEREAEEESRGRQFGSRTGAMALGGPGGGSQSQLRVAASPAELRRLLVYIIRERTDERTSGATHPGRDSLTYVSDPRQPLNQQPSLAQRRSHPDPSSLNDGERHLGTRNSAGSPL